MIMERTIFFRYPSGQPYCTGDAERCVKFVGRLEENSHILFTPSLDDDRFVQILRFNELDYRVEVSGREEGDFVGAWMGGGDAERCTREVIDTYLETGEIVPAEGFSFKKVEKDEMGNWEVPRPPLKLLV